MLPLNRLLIKLATLLGTLALCACDRPAPATPKATGAPAAASPAAATYRSAFARLGKDTNLLIGSVTLRAQGAEFDASAGGSKEQAFAVLKEKQDIVADLVAASQQPECRFSLPRATGGEPTQDVMEFAGSLRSAARLLYADAARLWSAGDTEGALTRIEAVYGMCSHAADEQVVLIALTVAAIEGLVNESVRQMAGGAAGTSLTSEQRQRLLKAIGRLHGTDPSGLLRAQQSENVTDKKLQSTLQQSDARVKQDLASAKAALHAE
jgi:hypothetical protein